jgi:hypothetical protein
MGLRHQVALSRIAVVSILAASVVSAAAASPRVARRVTGTVERVIHAQGPCRGGVRVTEEEMQEWAAKTQHLPIAKATFTVFAGHQFVGKPVTRFKTDGAARFEVSLPEGTYCVMAGDLKERAADKLAEPVKAVGGHIDAECMRERELACDAHLSVRKDNPRAVKLTLETFTRCPQPWAQPCYRGPMPP